jgi:hypothetical protein
MFDMFRVGDAGKLSQISHVHTKEKKKKKKKKTISGFPSNDR